MHQLEKRAKAAKGTAEQTVILEELDELLSEPEEEKAADTEYPDDEQNITGNDAPKELLRRGLAPEHVADLVRLSNHRLQFFSSTNDATKFSRK
jgi:hypothetical protein